MVNRIGLVSRANLLSKYLWVSVTLCDIFFESLWNLGALKWFTCIFFFYFTFKPFTVERLFYTTVNARCIETGLSITAENVCYKSPTVIRTPTNVRYDYGISYHMLYISTLYMWVVATKQNEFIITLGAFTQFDDQIYIFGVPTTKSKRVKFN